MFPNISRCDVYYHGCSSRETFLVWFSYKLIWSICFIITWKSWRRISLHLLFLASTDRPHNSVLPVSKSYVSISKWWYPHLFSYVRYRGNEDGWHFGSLHSSIHLNYLSLYSRNTSYPYLAQVLYSVPWCTSDL